MPKQRFTQKQLQECWDGIHAAIDFINSNTDSFGAEQLRSEMLPPLQKSITIMKEFEITGKIIFETGGWSGFDKIKIEQPDGLKIDLISRAKELAESFGAPTQIQYWTSKVSLTADQCVEETLKKLYGAIGAEYDTEVSGGCPTCGPETNYISTLEIGGHDLFRELRHSDGKYLLIQFQFS